MVRFWCSASMLHHSTIQLLEEVRVRIVRNHRNLELLPLVQLLLNRVDLALDDIPRVRTERKTKRRIRLLGDRNECLADCQS